jgi:hypothetical protein
MLQNSSGNGSSKLSAITMEPQFKPAFLAIAIQNG